jgi:hypothetical protein
MAGFLFRDPEQRLCMTIGEETIRPGAGVRAVVWAPEDRRWGGATIATYSRPAAATLDDPAPIRTPALAASEPGAPVATIWPLAWHRARLPSRRS